MDWFVSVCPQQWLIYLCNKAKGRCDVLSNPDVSNLVLRISDSIAVKLGPGVSPGEAATQKYAYDHLDSRIVRIPKVYRYFQDQTKPSWPIGYLFMEYIPGKTLDQLGLDANEASDRVKSVAAELGSLSGDVPGPVGGGTIEGYLWGDDGTREAFGCVEDMNRWLNKRLKLINKTIDLSPYPLVLCHLDLCRRNIKLTESGLIYLLDWGHAGFFPRFFEIAALSCINDDFAYSESLLQATKTAMAPTEEEEKCVWLLLRASAASLRYLFEPLEGIGMPADIDSWPPLPPLNP